MADPAVATMPPPARLGHEFQSQQAPPPEIQKNIEKAMAEKEAVLEKGSRGFLDGLSALGDQNSAPNDGRTNTQKVEKEVAPKAKVEKKPAKTAEDIQKAPEEGVAKPLSADPVEALEQLAEAETATAAKETPTEEVKAEVQKQEIIDPKEKEKYKWGELKAKAEEYDKKLEEWSTKEKDWQKQISEREERLKAIEEKAQRAEELEKKMEEYRVKVAKADILEDPEYQENFVKPYEGTMGFLKGAADAYGMNWPSLLQIMEGSKSDVERNMAFAELIANNDKTVDIVTQNQMANAMLDITKLREYDRQLKTNSLQAWEAMQLEKEARTKAEQEKSTTQRREDAKAAFRRMQKSIPEMKDVKEEEWVNDLAMAEHPPALRAAQAYALRALPMVIQNAKKENASLKAEVERLNGIIKARSNGGPRIDGAANGSSASHSSANDDSRPLGERLAGLR